jgi:hypothetical protein
MPKIVKKKPCQFKYVNDPERRCRKFSTETSNMCSHHLFVSKRKQNIAEEKKADDASTISIEDNVEEDADAAQPPQLHSAPSNASDDSINLCREFVFSCIDDYFKLQKQRTEYLEALAGKQKKSSGMDMSTMFSIGAVSLLPILLKHLNISSLLQGNAYSHESDAKPMEQQGSKGIDPIQGRCNPFNPGVPAQGPSQNASYEVFEATKVHDHETSRKSEIGTMGGAVDNVE